MKEKSLKAIEFDRILSMLSELCIFRDNKEQALKLTPSTDIEFVREELLKADVLSAYIYKYSDPRLDSASGAYEAVIHSTKGAMLSCGELLSVARMYRNFDRIKKWYFAYERTDSILDWQISSITENPQLEKAITEAIISENQVADTASDGLYDVRRKIKQTESSVRDKLDHIIKSQTYQKYLQESVVTIRQNKFVVPVKAEYKNEISGVVHDVSASGSTYFIEPAIVADLNAKIMQLYNQEQEEINKILMKFSQLISSNSGLFTDSYKKLLDVDKYIARAKLAIRMNAIMPQVNEELKFCLNKARHPLIEKSKVVPTDISLGFDYDTMIITGPNTGGKTVSLKTAGLLCAMAASGLLIPAHESSSVCLFGSILVDIGDEQSIQQSLSTFSGHMTNIAKILKQADENSLVLMDELGAGTDPAEGAALALSIIEQLRRQGARVMATTHYGELKIYALEAPGVQNASCEFDTETLRPTYRIIMGVPGKSNAFYISKRLGIGDEIIENAKAHLSNDEKNLNKVFSQLEDMRKQLKASQEEIEELKDYQAAKMRQAEEKSAKIIRKAQQEADLLTRRARQNAQKVQDEAYRLSDELKVLQKQENVSAQQRLQKARDIARNQSQKLISMVEEKEEAVADHPQLESVKKGDKVIIASLNKAAVVQGPANSNGMVDVVAGIIKTKVHISDLYMDTSKPKQPQKQYRNVQPKVKRDSNGRDSNTEINLLGMTVDDAILEVDRFLDNGIMQRLNVLYIIHGKGTGALRSGIHQHLRKHPHVRTFRLGTYGEGESGVTVVELK
ncbi:MAG: endonuclease MutS2 [Oscillospiraceae bacterium]|nr:endonuclease MutS2 [Oscillospiraceae bacterium]